MATSGSPEFDKLKEHLQTNPTVLGEVQQAFSALVNAANPKDRGARFLYGGGAEWILASAAWSAGILSAPAGHNQNGFDLADLLEKAEGLWSIKASASTSPREIHLRNYDTDAGRQRGWTDPTIFVAAYLGGALYVDPRMHTSVSDKVFVKDGALRLKWKPLTEFRDNNPDNFVEIHIENSDNALPYDGASFAQSILEPKHFPHLSKPFLAAAPTSTATLVDAIANLAALKEAGALTEEQFQQALANVLP